MKKILKLSLLLTVVLTTGMTYADEADFSLYVKKGEGKEVRFALNGITKVTMSIYDEDGKLIYTEAADGERGILRTYNLDEFPEGNYYLEAETDAKIARYEIRVSDRKATLSNKPVTEVFKPVMTSKDGKVNLNIRQKVKSAVAVTIYDAADNEVYTTTISGENIDKTFDFSQNTKGNYTFVMTYNNKMFVETIASK